MSYRVIVHTGHEYSAELTDISKWQISAENMNGFWVGTPTFRGLPIDQRINIRENGNQINAVAEIPFTRLKERVYHNIDAAEEAGMIVDIVMCYEEGQWGSTLTLGQIAEAKQILADRGKKYALILNVRSWVPDRVLDAANLTRGFSLEFAVTTDSVKLNNMIEGIKWGIDNNKWVYLLTPPNHTDHHIDKKYLWDYQTMRRYIKNRIGSRYYNSKFRWVPANYNFSKNGGVGGAEEKSIENGGVYNANTTMGVCRWLSLIR